MKTNGIHISSILIDYRNQCVERNEAHEFNIRPERIYFGLSTMAINPHIKSMGDLVGYPFVVVHVPGELNVLRIHAIHSATPDKIYVYNDDHVILTDVDLARLNGVISCAIYQHSSNLSLTHVNF